MTTEERVLMDHLESLGIKGVTLHQIKNISILNELAVNHVRIPTFEAARRLLNDSKSMEALRKEATFMFTYDGHHMPGGATIQHRIEATVLLPSPMPTGGPTMILLHSDCDHRVVNGHCAVCDRAVNEESCYWAHAADCGCHTCLI